MSLNDGCKVYIYVRCKICTINYIYLHNDDQIRIIKCLHKFLKPGGTMFIEDIYQEYKEEDYFLSLKNFISHFKEIYFVETEHKNNFSPLWKNNKILILEK